MLRYRVRLFAPAVAVALLTGGCATTLTVDAIHPGDEPESDYVSTVTAAYRDKAGNVTLCVTGMPAGANAWLGDTRDYSIHYPGASSPALEVFYHESIPQYPVVAADVRGPCPKTVKGMTVLPVHRVHAREFGDGDYFEMSDDALSDFFEDRAEAPAIYLFDYRFLKEYGTDLTNIVYVHETQVQRNARAVEIDTRPRTREGSPAHALLLPFAAIYDVITFPVQLLFAISYAG